MGGTDVQGFLQHLATERRGSASTPRAAPSAPLFLHREVLGQDLPWMTEIGRPHTARRLPCVMTAGETVRDPTG